ncbi:hypothetical protein [Sphingobacterium yanglingense]|nr:hypothetical protein [Sphingobacterium yanglingense]
MATKLKEQQENQEKKRTSYPAVRYALRIMPHARLTLSSVRLAPK